MKRAGTLVFDTMNSTGNTTHPFPLTPALSLGEREHLTPLFTDAEPVGFSIHLSRRKAFEFGRHGCWLFPLPEGEGQGEGERDFSTSSGATSV
jgi:hypothetical protein